MITILIIPVVGTYLELSKYQRREVFRTHQVVTSLLTNSIHNKWALFMFWVHTASRMCRFISFYQIWDVFGHYSVFFVPLCLFPFSLEFPCCICWYTWWCPTGPLASVKFSLVFVALKLDNFNWLVFKFVDSFLFLFQPDIEIL